MTMPDISNNGFHPGRPHVYHDPYATLYKDAQWIHKPTVLSLPTVMGTAALSAWTTFYRYLVLALHISRVTCLWTAHSPASLVLNYHSQPHDSDKTVAALKGCTYRYLWFSQSACLDLIILRSCLMFLIYCTASTLNIAPFEDSSTMSGPLPWQAWYFYV